MSEPRAVPPGDKDWTWVLDQPCPECGFDAGSVAPASVAGLIRDNAFVWLEVLAGADAGRRPSPDIWSALEYACHVRDVLRLYDWRLKLMLTEHDPLFAGIRTRPQSSTATTNRIRRRSHPTSAAAEQLAVSFEAVEGDQWHRPGRRSDGAAFTVDSFARYFIHDPIHHLHDVGGGATKPRG